MKTFKKIHSLLEQLEWYEMKDSYIFWYGTITFMYIQFSLSKSIYIFYISFNMKT